MTFVHGCDSRLLPSDKYVYCSTLSHGAQVQSVCSCSSSSSSSHDNGNIMNYKCETLTRMKVKFKIL